MATVKTKSSTNSIEKNNFDYIQAYAKTQSSSDTVVAELVQAYILIAQNMGISPFELVQRMKMGTISSATLAGQMNSVRSKNALIGASPTLNTPTFIAREISA